MNWKDTPIVTTSETKIEALPIEPSVKDILDKVLEQNKMILEQNARILAVLASPMMVIKTNGAN